MAARRAGGRRTSTRPAPPKTIRVAIAFDLALDKRALLEAALARADFWRCLERARRLAQVGVTEFRVLVKPDLASFDRESPTGTDPELVEHLVHLLHARGYARVSVGGARDDSARWLENRDVLVRADLLGYRFETPGGGAYDVVDLADDLVPVSFPPGSVLQGIRLGRAWVDAHYRICFAKNKTDEQHGYALCLESLIGLLPCPDQGRHRWSPPEVCVELLRQTPVHFGLVDAFVSNHGGAGTRAVRPIRTRTIIASGDPLLADCVAADKMGLDPALSPLTARALRDIGRPDAWEVSGDRRQYPGWVNVNPLLSDSVRRRNAWPEAARVVAPWLQAVNAELFPFRSEVDARLNAVLQRYLPCPDESAPGLWTLVGANHALGLLHEVLQSLRILYFKDSLRWVEAPLGIDPASHARREYDAVVPYVEGLTALLGDTPPEEAGLRWRSVDGSVVFEFSRVVPAPFEEFVGRVDVSRGIQFMNDYIGGTAVPVTRDAAGRVTRQAERNLYLPQPNYVALWGGPVIDVTKLERIRYRPGEHRIFWKTVLSENGSARYDDGSLAFTRTADGETSVSITGRQEFALPPLLAALPLDLYPPLKDYLIWHAYTTFFARTIANFEAVFEGRQIRIGRPWPSEAGDESAATGAAEAMRRLGHALRRHRPGVAAVFGPPRPAPSHVDEDGFAHFTGRAASQNGHGPAGDHAAGSAVGAVLAAFLRDLAAAAQKDWSASAGSVPPAP